MVSVEVSPGEIWNRVLHEFPPIEELGCFYFRVAKRAAGGGLRVSQSVNLPAFSDVHCEPGGGELEVLRDCGNGCHTQLFHRDRMADGSLFT